MGFLDALLGGRTKSSKQPAPDRLFAMTTAQVTLDTSLGPEAPRASPASSSSRSATSDFEQIVKDTEELLRSTAKDTGTHASSPTDDEFGYRWLDPARRRLRGPRGVAQLGLEQPGDGRLRRPAAGRRVRLRGEKGQPIYFIYNFKRGAYYPFVPTGDKQRDNERELRLKAQIGPELPIEPELERWFPLWEIPL